MLDYIENCLRTIGDFFNFLWRLIDQFMSWFSSAYPLTFRLTVLIFCFIVALSPFVIASIETFRGDK